MAEIDKDVQDNYHGLVASTGESYTSIADRIEGSDDLVAWLRAQEPKTVKPAKATADSSKPTRTA